MHLNHDEFGHLTPRQLRELSEGWRKREDHTMWQLAWATAWLLKPYVQKGRDLTPEQLLGRQTDEPTVDPEDGLLTTEEKLARIWVKIETQRRTRGVSEMVH